MPAPEFEWKTYEVPARGAGATRTREAAAPPEGEALSVEIPDLSPWATPANKAKILLESAAEVEHALLVQYLYAAFSLRSSDDVTDPAQKSALESWPFVLHFIARQEMAHLMTAQNLLLALGLAPNLEREDFPPHKDLYPFPMHLEPLSQRSLAKYVAAESPADVTGIDDILALATESAGAGVNHVGALYAMLAVVFSTREQVSAGGSGSEAWDEMLRQYAAAAHQQAPPAEWHLPDGAIDPGTLPLQGHPGAWPGGGVHIHEIADRAAALKAIRAVAEEGEGSTGGDEESHFGLLRGMFRGGADTIAFPPPGAWAPARPVPTDPKPDEVAEPRTRRWAQLADLRYGLLLGFIEHYLRTTDEDDRANLSSWALGEMSTLRALADKLATLAHGSGVAGLPFTLPTTLHLPATERDRWQLQRARTNAAMQEIQEMQAADPADAADSLLSGLMGVDTSRLPLMHGDTGLATPTTSFAADILPLFRPVDVEHMSDQVAFDLTDYERVRSSATSISARLKRTDQRRMPPPPDDPWPPDRIALFDRWIAEGTPP